MTKALGFLKLFGSAFLALTLILLYSGYDAKESRANALAKAFELADRGIPSPPVSSNFLKATFSSVPEKKSLDAFYGGQADAYMSYSVMIKNTQDKAGLGPDCSSVNYHGSENIVKGIENSTEALACCMPPSPSGQMPVIFNKDKSITFFVCGDASLTHVVSMATSDVNQIIIKGLGVVDPDFDISSLE
jgi:hypothetical protein